MNAFQLLRPITLLLLTVWTGICLALPAPHDIEQAVANGQLPQAERMLREVIAEKPRSARAHYELGQVLAREGQYTEALQAIRTSREIDPSLKFAQSTEKFEAVSKAIEHQATSSQKAHVAAAGLVATQPVALAAPAAPAQPAWLWPALLTGGFALLVLWLWRRVQAQPALQPQPASMGGYGQAPRGFGAPYDPRGPAPAYGGPYAASPSGSGMAGAVVGGLAGVAAGYALSKALESHDHPVTGADSHTVRTADPMEDVGRVRMDNVAPDSTDLGGFDAGQGDGWDIASGSDDSW